MERGRPQGDCPSPRQYNIAQQVLLLKLELDSNIIEIIPRPICTTPVTEKEASFNVTPEIKYGMEKTECFADDANACCEQSVTAVDAILGILYNFGMISWLKCNIEKTTVMLIGPKLPDVEHRIIEVGFNLVERQRVLGFYLSNETEEFCDINWNKTMDKIRLIIEQWKILEEPFLRSIREGGGLSYAGGDCGLVCQHPE